MSATAKSGDSLHLGKCQLRQGRCSPHMKVVGSVANYVRYNNTKREAEIAFYEKIAKDREE
jgi:hypothetical protein